MPFTSRIQDIRRALVPRSRLPSTRTQSTMSTTTSGDTVSDYKGSVTDESCANLGHSYGNTLPRYLDEVPKYRISDSPTFGHISEWNSAHGWVEPSKQSLIPQVGSETWPHVYLQKTNEVLEYGLSYAPPNTRHFCFWHPAFGWLPETARPLVPLLNRRLKQTFVNMGKYYLPDAKYAHYYIAGTIETDEGLEYIWYDPKLRRKHYLEEEVLAKHLINAMRRARSQAGSEASQEAYQA